MIGSILRRINETYQWLDEYADPRTRKMPLIDSPFSVLYVVLAYFVGILVLLKFMEK